MGTPESRRACVIGAGFGGLALAIRLQSAGVATTLIEALDQPGGHARAWQQDGFTFSAGPTVIEDARCFRELWELGGHDLAADVELLQVDPAWRFNWADGATLDLCGDAAQLRRQIARIDPQDVAGYEALLRYAEGEHRETGQHMAARTFLDWRTMAAALPTLGRQQAWRSAYQVVSRFVGNEKLRAAVTAPMMLAGGNPLAANAATLPMQPLVARVPAWAPRGGMQQLAVAMARHFERLGGELRLGDAVVGIETQGVQCTKVESRSGWTARFDAIASNADVVHTYRNLLQGTLPGRTTARKLVRRSFSPSAFVVHFGVEGSWPGIPHRMALMGGRYTGLLQDIHQHGVLPADSLIFLHHPSVTDPSLAPEGKSTFQAVVPVAHTGKLTVDWGQVGPVLERRVLDEVGRRLIPDIHDRLAARFHYTPANFSSDLGAHLGSAFGLAPVLHQSAWLRPHNRDRVLRNLYLVGAATHPGPGVGGVIAGARLTADLMLRDMAD